MEIFMTEEEIAPLEISLCIPRSKGKAVKWHLSIVSIRNPPQALQDLEEQPPSSSSGFYLPPGCWVILDESVHLFVLIFFPYKVEILISYSSGLHKRQWEEYCQPQLASAETQDTDV